MKNTEKDIIERFQKFDFDPQEKVQKQVFNRLIFVPAVKRKFKRMPFVFATVLGALLTVVLISDKEYISKSGSIKQETELSEKYTAGSENTAAAYEAKEELAEPSSVEAEYAKDVLTEEINPGKVQEKIAVKAYDENVFEKDMSAEENGTNEAVMSPDTAAAKFAPPSPRSAAGEKKIISADFEAAGSETKEKSVSLKNFKPSRSVDKKTDGAVKMQYSKMLEAKLSAEAESVGDKRAAGAARSRKIASAAAPAPAQEVYSISYAAPDYNGIRDESYKKYEENSFRSTVSDPLSTFSADVDVAAYNIVRHSIMSGRKPNPDSVRIEEFLNYFDYSYPQPEGSDPVSINFEYTDSPWNKDLKLIKIGIKAKDIEKNNLPPSNLVFLIDVSGSMEQENRLPLVKKSLKMLVDELRPEDRVSIVTYANGVNELLSGAKGSEKERIVNIIENLHAGGGTSGSQGLALAYETAKKNYILKGNNRIILATDGDFNIGPRSESELENQITEARESGVFLSVLGYGMGNYKDSKMQIIANKGNGNYAYINDLFEAQKILVKEFGAALFTVAKDVKLQVEFNPAFAAAYRLVGYEKRALNTQDFNDDKKDAGEMGAGHTVTVIYEFIPAGVKSVFLPDVEALKYTKTASPQDNDDILTLKLRYKEPDSDTGKLMERQLKQNAYVPFDKSSDDMRFAASVAQFGQILKDSRYKGDMTINDIIQTAKKAKGADDEGYRTYFIKMVEMYKMIK
ncbi:MAG: VWA domain-containing protein [Endomicrobia bacterium]|nr:VWA domain-containing protein [Endomicrobiia bacterium]